jgi:signal transduction histidine kinase
MRERAQALGGTFTIDDREGTGTIVVVTLPLVVSAAGEAGSHGATTVAAVRRAG